MVKILIGLGALVLLFNPLTGVVLMDFAISGWTYAMREGGWIVTGLFALFSVFYMGGLYARMTSNDKVKQIRGITNAKLSKKDKKDGMVLESQ